MKPVKDKWRELIPWLYREQIREQADAFLAKYNPKGTLPVPIDRIADLQLGINVLGYPGLEREIGTVGYITSDLKEIVVDLHVEESVPHRLRWTIAHELGHYILHGNLYRAQNFSSPETWKAWIHSIPEKDNSRLEWQANTMAAQILMPVDELTREFDSRVSELKEKGVNWTDAPKIVLSPLSRLFEVAPKNVGFALLNEGIVSDPSSS